MTGVHEPAPSRPPDRDAAFVRWLLARQQPTNVMVDSAVHQVDEVALALLHWCRQPIWYHRLPGRLDLPDATAGTLLLADAGVLTRDQSRALDQWLDRQQEGMTVVSVTSVPADHLLNACEWPLRLLYRLNMVRVAAEDILALPCDDDDRAIDQADDESAVDSRIR